MDKDQLEKLYEKAETLPRVAQTMAASSYAPFVEKYPELKEVKQAEWIAILFVANVYGALLQLMPMRKFSAELISGLIDETERNAKPLFPQFLEAYQSVSGFMQEHFFRKNPTQNEAARLTQTLGTWIFGSLFQKGPQQEQEHHLAIHLGNAVLLPFKEYWK